MRVLLIYPPINALVPAKSTLLGLGYLASVLRMRGHDVEILDLIDKREFSMKIADTICITDMFNENKEEVKGLISGLKNTFSTIHIVVGGSHASTFPEEMLEHADCVVVGEGEEVICDIVENRRHGIVKTERIRDLDKIPFPSWDLMWKDIEEINRRNWHTPFHIRRPFIHMITSRGCPNACTFCAVKVAWGRQWISRSAKNVVDEIEQLYKLGFREIHFNDDNCSINVGRMYQICEEIMKRKINIKIACPTGIHIMTLNKCILEVMKRAGFYRLCFGIETGNPEMQKTIKKNIDLDKARQVIRFANELGYWTSATFILGFPGETEKQANDTFEFAKTSGIDLPIYYNLNLQPKTEIYERLQSQL